jgi:hypothetical protein
MSEINRKQEERLVENLVREIGASLKSTSCSIFKENGSDKRRFEKRCCFCNQKL